MDVKRMLLLSGVFCLSACASVPGAQTSENTKMHSNGLSARTLALGDCGLFVWTADAQKQFVLYGQSQNGRASWLSPSGEIIMASSGASGTATEGQFPTQTFTHSQYGEITLKLRSPEAISNGTRYRAGTLKAQDENGWARVTPVVGLSACKRTTNTAF